MTEPYPEPAKGKRNAAGRKQGADADAEARREVIWNLVLIGTPEWKITKAIVEEYGVTDRTVRRDFAVLGARIKAEAGPELVDRKAAACLERIEQIAVEAQTGKTPEGTAAKKDLRLALNANVQLARLLGVKDARWRDTGANGGAGDLRLPASDRSTLQRLAEALLEFEGTPDADLLAEHARLSERLVGLRLLPGGRADANPAAPASGTKATG